MHEEHYGDPSRQSSASEKLRDQAQTLKEDVRDLGGVAKEAAREKYGEARHRATEAYESGRRKVDDTEERIVAYIRQKPLQSVLIAAGLGMVFGMLRN